MSESNFREIQLNTKQVVFLFMACVVALLGVFLLGVSVGHGVSSDGTTAAAGAASGHGDQGLMARRGKTRVRRPRVGRRGSEDPR